MSTSDLNEKMAAHSGWFQFFAAKEAGVEELPKKKQISFSAPSPPPSPPSSEWYEKIETEINGLHAALESQGINSKNTTDVFNRQFNLPVDEEHKAKVFGMGIIAKGVQQPHLRAFWAATFGFFSCFFSVFAPAALVPYLKKSAEEGGIGLTKVQGAEAGAAAVASTIVMRILCGPMCDVFGARRTFVLLLLLACPGIIGLMFITDGNGLIVCRFFIGLGLASFVTCQVWCSQMFSKSVVGIANATAGGWGNLGGGVTQLVMPYVMLGFLSATGNDVRRSLQLCFLVPLGLHILSSLCVISGRDLPDGNYGQLEKKGVKAKGRGLLVAKIGASNVNAWIMTLTYGLCFGVELTMNNKVVPYFSQYYGVDPQIAGILGSTFGLMNLFARSWGGLLSDAMNKKFGMRGRIWGMWIVQTIEGMLCLFMGIVTMNYPNPDDNEFVGHPLGDAAGKMAGQWKWTSPQRVEVVNGVVSVIPGEELVFSINASNGMIGKCATKQIETPDGGWLNYGTGNDAWAPLPTDDAFIMISDPWNECIRNSAPLGVTMIVMILFSAAVQMAEGLHFGIVPMISRPALGVVSGMVGAGGNFGGVMGSRYIVGPKRPLDDGFIWLGIMIMTMSLVMFGIYFPDKGGMLFKAGSISYDPQLIKPPADMKGADQLNYKEAGNKTLSTSTSSSSANAPGQASV